MKDKTCSKFGNELYFQVASASDMNCVEERLNRMKSALGNAHFEIDVLWQRISKSGALDPLMFNTLVHFAMHDVAVYLLKAMVDDIASSSDREVASTEQPEG